MVRLSKKETQTVPGHGPHTVIRIDGVLDATSLKDLRDLIGPDMDPARVSLDLSGLTSLDAQCAVFIAGLQAGGCQVRGASMYINRQIQEFTR